MKNLKEAAVVIEALEVRVAALEAHVIALTTQMHTAQAAPARGARNYGPNSEVPMTDVMAWRIRYGDLKGTPVKEIADNNGLSRGQVYSVRGNYTFTKVGPASFSFVEETDAEGNTEVVIK